jgi:hypothetical protein
MAKTAASSTGEIVIFEQTRGKMQFCVLGTTPLIHNRMSQKALQELLFPKGKKNAAEKAISLKHNPLQEFRDSPYIIKDESANTLISLLPSAFKGTMMTAALDMPGVARTQIKKHIYVEGQAIEIYGIPQILMATTRSADINRTPDVRTRAVMPEWACKLTIEFTKPLLKEQSVANLLAAGGMVSGVGDWRQEKGSGNYGCFKLVSEDDKDFQRIVKSMSRKAQAKALEHPECFDNETEELLSWFETETKRRGFTVHGRAAA